MRKAIVSTIVSLLASTLALAQLHDAAKDCVTLIDGEPSSNRLPAYTGADPIGSPKRRCEGYIDRRHGGADLVVRSFTTGGGQLSPGEYEEVSLSPLLPGDTDSVWVALAPFDDGIDYRVDANVQRGGSLVWPTQLAREASLDAKPFGAFAWSKRAGGGRIYFPVRIKPGGEDSSLRLVVTLYGEVTSLAWRAGCREEGGPLGSWAELPPPALNEPVTIVLPSEGFRGGPIEMRIRLPSPVATFGCIHLGEWSAGG